MWFKNKKYILALAVMFMSNVESSGGADQAAIAFATVNAAMQPGGPFSGTGLYRGIDDRGGLFHKSSNQEITIIADEIMQQNPDFYKLIILKISGQSLQKLADMYTNLQTTKPFVIDFTQRTPAKTYVQRYVFDVYLSWTGFNLGYGGCFVLNTYKIAEPKQIPDVSKEVFRRRTSLSDHKELLINGNQVQCADQDGYATIDLNNDTIKTALIKLAENPTQPPVVIEKFIKDSNSYYKYRFVISWAEHNFKGYDKRLAEGNKNDGYTVSTSYIYLSDLNASGLSVQDIQTLSTGAEVLKVSELTQERVLKDKQATDLGFSQSSDSISREKYVEQTYLDNV